MICRQLIYTSRVDTLAVGGMLLQILKLAQSNNYKYEISGLLVYRQGRFMQLLEGDADNVKTLFHNIYHDSRHSDVEVVLEKDSTQRNFPTWAMGFGDGEGSQGSLMEQTFYFSLEDIKKICSALNDDVGNTFLEFLGG